MFQILAGLGDLLRTLQRGGQEHGHGHLVGTRRTFVHLSSSGYSPYCAGEVLQALPVLAERPEWV